MKYSVIIPAYNAEATLRRCLDSLLSQNRTDMEIILISDGSTDGTDAIAQGYGNKIRFLRTEHRGVSAARNWGLDAASGCYVTFVDSDDWVSPDYFAAMDACPDCQLLVLGVPKGEGNVMARLFRTRTLDSVCNKRIRRDFLQRTGIRFGENLSVGEDFLFCFSLAVAAESMALSESCVYHADLSNDNSLSRGYRPRLAEDMEFVFLQAAQLGRYPEILDYWNARACLTCLAELWKAGRPKKEDIRRVCGHFRKPIGPSRGIVHRLLRLALGRKWDSLLFWLAYLGKGRKFWKRRRS